MTATIRILNEIKRAGIFLDYAIGGAAGALFYAEPMETADLDVYVAIPSPAGGIIDLGPVYDFLKERGYAWNGQWILVEGIPTEFLPTDALTEEGLIEAVTHDVDGERVKVFSPEYILAGWVRASRPKDLAKIPILLEQGGVDRGRFDRILAAHGLTERWNGIQTRLGL